MFRVGISLTVDCSITIGLGEHVKILIYVTIVNICLSEFNIVGHVSEVNCCDTEGKNETAHRARLIQIKSHFGNFFFNKLSR